MENSSSAVCCSSSLSGGGSCLLVIGRLVCCLLPISSWAGEHLSAVGVLRKQARTVWKSSLSCLHLMRRCLAFFYLTFWKSVCLWVVWGCEFVVDVVFFAKLVKIQTELWPSI